jgi:hypothetical protein
MVAMPVIQAMVRGITKDDCGPGQPGQKARPSLQNNQSKRACSVVQVVELLPSKRKALSSNPSMEEEEGEGEGEGERK